MKEVRTGLSNEYNRRLWQQAVEIIKFAYPNPANEKVYTEPKSFVPRGFASHWSHHFYQRRRTAESIRTERKAAVKGPA